MGAWKKGTKKHRASAEYGAASSRARSLGEHIGDALAMDALFAPSGYLKSVFTPAPGGAGRKKKK